MRGALALTSVVFQIAGVSATCHWNPKHRYKPMLDKVTLVTYHKTGTVLARGVNDDCFAGLGIQFEPQGHLVLPAVHFARDPKALVRSAYDYHKVSEEPWLHDPNHRRPWLWNDWKVGSTYWANETYQEYLNRVPFYTGIRAEFLRSTHAELKLMVENTNLCMAHPDSCVQVCLEHFTRSSQSYQTTWSTILDFLGLDQSYMDCINGYDLLNPNYVGEAEEHATHPTHFQSAAVYSEFAKLDEELLNNTLTRAGLMWGCAPVTLRPQRGARSLNRDERLDAEERADRYG